MWDLPSPGLEPVSPALAGRFSTTAPPGKPSGVVFIFVSDHLLFNWRQVQSSDCWVGTRGNEWGDCLGPLQSLCRGHAVGPAHPSGPAACTWDGGAFPSHSAFRRSTEVSRSRACGLHSLQAQATVRQSRDSSRKKGTMFLPKN